MHTRANAPPLSNLSNSSSCRNLATRRRGLASLVFGIDTIPLHKGASLKTPLAIAALVAATMTVSAVPSFAQDAGANPPPPAAPAATHDQGPGKGMGPNGRGMRNGPFPMLALACSDKGPAALDKMFDRTDQRLNLSTDQQKLFEAFKAKALTAETTFADACQAARPDRSAEKRPDLLERMKAGLAIDQARLTAMNSALPEFEAFYNSLTDQQKADLLPHHGGRGGMDHDGGPDRNGPPPPAQNS